VSQRRSVAGHQLDDDRLSGTGGLSPMIAGSSGPGRLKTGTHSSPPAFPRWCPTKATGRGAVLSGWPHAAQWKWCPSPCGDPLFGRVRYRVQNGVVCGAGTEAQRRVGD